MDELVTQQTDLSWSKIVSVGAVQGLNGVYAVAYADHVDRRSNGRGKIQHVPKGVVKRRSIYRIEHKHLTYFSF